MGVYSYEYESEIAISPAKFFKAFILEADTFFPKMVPHVHHKVEILEGHGGAGTIKKISYGAGDSLKYIKQKIEKIDIENFIYKYSVIEGEALWDVIEKIEKEIKLVEKHGGGCTVKAYSTYYVKEGAEIPEEKIKTGEKMGAGLVKAAETYLVSHSDEYN